MSLSWRKQLLAVLSPEAVDYAVSPRPGRRKTLALQGRVASPDSGQAAARWRGAVVALAEVLGNTKARNADCNIVLSNHFVRSQILAWNDAFKNTRQFEALARARFRALHGAVADSWDVRLGQLQYGMPTIACAVDAALISELEALVTKDGNRLASVQPYFSTTFDRYRSPVRAAVWWFVCLEPGRLWLGRLANGVWSGISSRVIGKRPVEETLQALAQEMAAAVADRAGRAEPVHAAVTGLQRAEVQALKDAGLSVRELRIGDFLSVNNFGVGNRPAEVV